MQIYKALHNENISASAITDLLMKDLKFVIE